MSEPYPEVVARFYDAVYAHIRDGTDDTFYLDRMVEAGGPVLEIGCGTGRLLRRALGRGVDAWGVDASPAMVARCRAQLPSAQQARVVVADAVSLRLDRRFALVTAPFRVLSHVSAVEDQLRLLAAVREHLLPGGAFVFDLYVPHLPLLIEGLPERVDFDGEWAPGRRLRRIVSSLPADLARQTNHVRMSLRLGRGRAASDGGLGVRHALLLPLRDRAPGRALGPAPRVAARGLRGRPARRRLAGVRGDLQAGRLKGHDGTEAPSLSSPSHSLSRGPGSFVGRPRLRHWSSTSRLTGRSPRLARRRLPCARGAPAAEPARLASSCTTGAIAWPSLS